MDHDTDGDGAINLSTSQRPSAATTPNGDIPGYGQDQQDNDQKRTRKKKKKREKEKRKINRFFDLKKRSFRGTSFVPRDVVGDTFEAFDTQPP
ncbi:forkhead box protein P2-like isoform X11 [Vespula maculifrons]|uniref:Forkhead box protein P2-like isoform X11 n=1 Tax=Vespula maculifrons TaxID=7453 RepID=A0ABD2CAZ7_VESMC